MLVEMVVESKCYIINGLDDINGGQWFWGWILRPEKDSVNKKNMFGRWKDGLKQTRNLCVVV